MRFIEEYWVFLIGIQLVSVGLLVLDLKLRKIKSKVVSISESLRVISEHLGVDKKIHPSCFYRFPEAKTNLTSQNEDIISWTESGIHWGSIFFKNFRRDFFCWSKLSSKVPIPPNRKTQLITKIRRNLNLL